MNTLHATKAYTPDRRAHRQKYSAPASLPRAGGADFQFLPSLSLSSHPKRPWLGFTLITVLIQALTDPMRCGPRDCTFSGWSSHIFPMKDNEFLSLFPLLPSILQMILAFSLFLTKRYLPNLPFPWRPSEGQFIICSITLC